MQRTAAYKRKRYKEDPIFRLRFNFCIVVGKSIKRGMYSWGWDEVFGYTIQELRCHLESLFQPSMTWENYGAVWHIDHIKPMSLFSFTSSDDPEFEACWSLKNLQPLFVHENLTKGAKYEE